MKGYFYPDTDHNDPKIIRDFCAYLPALQQQGIRVVFLEFLFEAVPADEQMSEHFITCSGGRRGMTKFYIEIVRLARKLKMEVVGLSRPGYFELSRSSPAQSFAYRLMGPFDGVAAWVIKKYADNRPFVVFLGSGHWPMLKHFLPGLAQAIQFEQEPVDPAKYTDSVIHMVDMIDLADRFSQGAYSANVLASDVEHAPIIEGVLRQYGRSEAVATLMQIFQDKVGLPPTTIQLNYLIARGRQLQFRLPALPPPVLRLRPSSK